MSGSETRKRTEVVAVRLLPEERRYLEVKASERGSSVGKLLHWCALPALLSDFETATDRFIAEDIAAARTADAAGTEP